MIDRASRADGAVGGLIRSRPLTRSNPLAWLQLGAADRSLVSAGDRVTPGQPLVERPREVHLGELPSGPAAAAAADAGAIVERGRSVGGEGRRSIHVEERGRVLFRAPDGRLRVAFGRHYEVLVSPVTGSVERLEAGALGIRCAGALIAGVLGWGSPVRGVLRFAVESPEAELRAGAIDVAAAGSILVAGARIDVEALTRARATGVRGIITGGIAGRDLRQLDAADARQRAGLAPTTPFALCVLDGYGRRPIAPIVWSALGRAIATEVAVLPEPAGILLDRSPALPSSDDDEVRIGAGDRLGREGRLEGIAGFSRQPSGTYRLAARVSPWSSSAGDDDAQVVPVADLERFAYPRRE